MDEKVNDSDYKIFIALINLVDQLVDGYEGEINKDGQFEMALFLYAYFFEKIYELKPELKDVIFMKFHCNVFMHFINYAEGAGIDKKISVDIHDFVSSRYVDSCSIIKNWKDNENYIPAKLIYSLFESPLEVVPSNSYHLTKNIILMSMLVDVFPYLDTLAERVIEYDLSFGSELKYKEYFENIMANDLLALDILRIVYTSNEECRKLCEISDYASIEPRGRHFIKASASVKLSHNSKDYLLLGALIIFDKWIESYKKRFGNHSISKESLLLLEHQIFQAHQV